MSAAAGRGVTAAGGFAAAGLHCGIKASALDLAVVVADRPASAAALFTTNVVKAAPVLVSHEHLQRSGGVARAVVINSGCANACTGDEGLWVARATAARAAASLAVPDEQVLVASTGVIGVRLDERTIAEGVGRALAHVSPATHLDAATAILTTDRGPKEAAVTVPVAGGQITIGGMAKGAGMIEPSMATMLAVLTTDAAVPPPLLDQALRGACKDTFNAITIDGDTSTNDTVFLLAGGAAGVSIGIPELPAFQRALTAVCLELALAVVRGGEGVTRLVEVRVRGTSEEAGARRVARTIANSLLVKTAAHGADPNWGRILAAAGRAGVPFDPGVTSVRIGPVAVFEDGSPRDDRAGEAAVYLAGENVLLEICVGHGPGTAVVYTGDLSAEYVRINAEYRT